MEFDKRFDMESDKERWCLCIGKMNTMEHLVLVERDHELKSEDVEFEMPLRYLRNDVNWADVCTVYISLCIIGTQIGESRRIYLGKLLV